MNCRLLALLIVLLSLCQPAFAQVKPAPKPAPAANPAGPVAPIDVTKPMITAELKSANEFLSDVEYIFTLAGSPKQYKTLLETLETFLSGVDRHRMVSVRSYLAGNDLTHIVALPVNTPKDLKDFLATAKDLDIRSKEVAGKKDIYELSKLLKGFLRFDLAGKEIFIAERMTDVTSVKTHTPSPLLAKFDFVLNLVNDPATVKSRQAAFDKVNKESLAAIKKGPKEDASDFAIRKMVAEQQAIELTRFLVESSKITLGWVTDTKSGHAELSIEMTGLPGTSLEESIQLIGKQPDEFATVPSQGSIVTGSLNFPLDDLRKKHTLDMLALSWPQTKQKIDANKNLSDEQKKTDKEFSDLVAEITTEATHFGRHAGFLRVYPAAAEHSFSILGAIKVEDEKKINDRIEKLAETQGKERFKLNVEKIGPVSIHILTAPEQHKKFPEFVAADGNIYLGISPKTFWYAAGPGAIDHLKQAIEATGAAPAAGDPAAAPASAGEVMAIDFHGRLGPWVGILDRLSGQAREHKPSDPSQLALDAFKHGKDTMAMKLWRTGDAVHVTVRFDEGLLRFAGKAAAQFVKDKLE